MHMHQLVGASQYLCEIGKTGISPHFTEGGTEVEKDDKTTLKLI